MEQNVNQKLSKKQTKKSEFSSITIDKETKKKLALILTKANKKDYGKKIKDRDILSIIIDRFTDEDIAKLHASSMSFEDRLDQEYRQFLTKNGHISKDEYLGKRLYDNSKISVEN